MRSIALLVEKFHGFGSFAGLTLDEYEDDYEEVALCIEQFGNVISHLKMRLRRKNEYFLLLKHCPAIRVLTIDCIDLNDLSISGQWIRS